MKKEILFVIDSLECAGAEKSLVSLLSLLDYSKYNVDLMLFAHGGMLEKWLPKEVNVLCPLEYTKFASLSLKEALLFSIRNWNFNMLAARIAYSFSIRWNKGENAVKARLYWERVSGVIPQNEKKYDAAISYAQGIPTFYAAEKARAKKKFAWVNTSYRLAAEERTYQRFFYQQFHQIITVSQPAKDIFLQTFPEYAEKTTVIYDILNYDFILQLADAVHPFDEPFHGIRILTIGRLAGEKGYDIALEAGKKLKEKGIDFKWHIIGQGPLKGEIWKYIKKNDLTDCFILMGITENPYPFIKNAHIYVQTSRYEGFGLAIAEARMLNIPVVATNFDAVHDQIIDGKNGLIVEMNAEAVCKGILKLIDDRTLRDNIKARLRAEKKGNMEEIEKIDQLIG